MSGGSLVQIQLSVQFFDMKNNFKIGDIVRIISKKRFKDKSLFDGLSSHSASMLRIDINSDLEFFSSGEKLKIISESKYDDNWVVVSKSGEEYNVHYRLLKNDFTKKVNKILNV